MFAAGVMMATGSETRPLSPQDVAGLRWTLERGGDLSLGQWFSGSLFGIFMFLVTTSRGEWRLQ